MTTHFKLRADEMFCHAIYTASHVINRAYAPMLARLDLTYPQYITLILLLRSADMSVGAVASALRMESSTMTPLLKRLEQRGLVTRERGTLDERQVFVSITEKGETLLKASPKITECMIEGTGLAENELETLVETLTALSMNLSDHPPKP